MFVHCTHCDHVFWMAERDAFELPEGLICPKCNHDIPGPRPEHNAHIIPHSRRPWLSVTWVHVIQIKRVKRPPRPVLPRPHRRAPPKPTPWWRSAPAIVGVLFCVILAGAVDLLRASRPTYIAPFQPSEPHEATPSTGEELYFTGRILGKGANNYQEILLDVEWHLPNLPGAADEAAGVMAIYDQSGQLVWSEPTSFVAAMESQAAFQIADIKLHPATPEDFKRLNRLGRNELQTVFFVTQLLLTNHEIKHFAMPTQ